MDDWKRKYTINWWSYWSNWSEFMDFYKIHRKGLWVVRLVIAHQRTKNNTLISLNITSVLVWAASPRGSYWVRKQRKDTEMWEMGQRGKKRMRTETELSRVSLSQRGRGPALPHTGHKPGSSETVSFWIVLSSLNEVGIISVIFIDVQSRGAICSSYIGQFDAKAASKHFNLSWHFHLSHINPHSHPPDSICNFICTVRH